MGGPVDGLAGLLRNLQALVAKRNSRKRQNRLLAEYFAPAGQAINLTMV